MVRSSVLLSETLLHQRPKYRTRINADALNLESVTNLEDAIVFLAMKGLHALTLQLNSLL